MSTVKISKNFFTRLYNLSVWYKIPNLEGWRLQRRENVHRLVLQDLRHICEALEVEEEGLFTFAQVLSKVGPQFLEKQDKLDKAKKFLKKQLKNITNKKL